MGLAGVARRGTQDSTTSMRVPITLPAGSALWFRVRRRRIIGAIFLLLCAVGLLALYRASWSPPSVGPAEGLATALVPRVLAPGLAVEQREVRIDAGDVTLFFPSEVSHPCPAVVQLHGSAATTPSQQGYFYTGICLRAGLAILAFDNRGRGESTGSYHSAIVAWPGAPPSTLTRTVTAHRVSRGRR